MLHAKKVLLNKDVSHFKVLYVLKHCRKIVNQSYSHQVSAFFKSKAIKSINREDDAIKSVRIISLPLNFLDISFHLSNIF